MKDLLSAIRIFLAINGGLHRVVIAWVRTSIWWILRCSIQFYVGSLVLKTFFGYKAL